MMDEDRPSGSSRKRAFLDDDDSSKAPPQKRVRFPKGKKVKAGDYVVNDDEAKPTVPRDPRLAAKDRAVRRTQITAELLDEENREILDDISRAEFHDYEDDETFIDGDIQIEPFNLSKEREEGYFDAEGNYVEYVKENEIKDAWLDSVEIKEKFVGKQPTRSREVHDSVETPELSSEEIAKIKRRIADLLEPGETILKALKRLKGASNNRKEKMSAETKQVFDGLTEDAVKLLNNGDLDVYSEKQETFQREAEGYERLAQARGQVMAMNAGEEKHGADNGDEAFDMFAEDDSATANPPADEASNHNLENNSATGGGDSHHDYIYDETTGYYYSSSSGYYYDPSTGLYYCAASGQWYSYNGESGTYEEVQQTAPAVS